MNLRTFEEAQAVAICWLHHFRGALAVVWEGMHPSSCEWCDYPQDVKLKAVEDYNRWAGSEGQRKAFFGLPGSVRLRLIREAQGLGR